MLSPWEVTPEPGCEHREQLWAVSTGRLLRKAQMKAPDSAWARERVGKGRATAKGAALQERKHYSQAVNKSIE